MSTTKGELAKLIRAVRALDPEDHSEQAEYIIMALNDDLGYTEILARAFPEILLAELEADSEGLLWPPKKCEGS